MRNCVECGDQKAEVICDQCEDEYCEVCWQALHRTGSRRTHTTKDVDGAVVRRAPPAYNAAYDDGADGVNDEEDSDDEGDAVKLHMPAAAGDDKGSKEEERKSAESSSPVAAAAAAAVPFASLRRELEQKGLIAFPDGDHSSTGGDLHWFARRAQFVPLRLTERERTLLALAESAMNVSEYSDKVDVFSRNHTGVVVEQIEDVCNLLMGLYTATHPKRSKAEVKGRRHRDNEDLLASVFEVARRHKVRNPDKMRTSYGKLMHILMDAQDGYVQRQTRLDLVAPLQTVHLALRDAGAMSVLSDPQLRLATCTVQSGGEGTTREDVQRAIATKTQAFEAVVERNSTPQNREQVRRCVLSLADSHSYLHSNCGPVDEMIGYLETYFDPEKETKHTSLSISYGRGGSLLSHGHKKHFMFVMQSLMLWRNVLNNMYQLWWLAEGDLTDPNNRYRLRNTGQGLHRMQACPRVSKAMSQLVRQAQKAATKNGWVGLSVVHLSDRDVPNAMVFVDKYAQVSRILGPIVQSVRELDRLGEDPSVAPLIEKGFGGVEALRTHILRDFFRHGFNGSGDDGGSCVDGRLTSAWNWCSLLKTKDFHHIFMLTGFVGFNGEFS